MSSDRWSVWTQFGFADVLECMEVKGSRVTKVMVLSQGWEGITFIEKTFGDAGGMQVFVRRKGGGARTTLVLNS